MIRPFVLMAACAVPLLAGLAPAARADEAADRHAAAVALLGQMHTTDNMTQLSASLVAQVRAAVTHGDPDLMKEYDGFAQHLHDEAESERASLADQIADVYANDYTTDELKQMAAFYQTPLGQKIVSTQIKISGEILDLTRAWGGRVSQKLADEARVNFQNAQ